MQEQAKAKEDLYNDFKGCSTIFFSFQALYIEHLFIARKLSKSLVIRISSSFQVILSFL